MSENTKPEATEIDQEQDVNPGSGVMDQEQGANTESRDTDGNVSGTQATDQEQDETPEVDEPNPNAEAAKYRKRLRETESERDQLATQVEALQQHIIDEYVDTKLYMYPAAFWAGGATVADLLDKDGNVDTEKVTASARDAADRLGIRMYERRILPNEGAVTNPNGSKSWESAFRG